MKTPLSLAVVAIAAIGWTVAGQGVKLVRLPKVGQENRLSLRAEIDLLGSSAVFTAIVVEKVTEVDSLGNYTIESRQTEAVTRLGDRETKVAETGVRSATYRPTGEIKEIKQVSPQGADVRLARLGGLVVPDRELKPGESWSHDYPALPESGNIAGKANYKYLKTETLDGKAAAVIEVKYKESSGASPAEANGKAWIEIPTGEMLKLESEWKNAPLMGPTVPLNAKVTLTRV